MTSRPGDPMTSDYTLAYGTHPNPDDGRCAMEWVAHIAGEPHSDQPACVSPVVRALCVALNDGLDCSARQRLRPYLTRTIGTSRDGLDERRAWMALDWLIRVYAPTWLRRAGLGDAAARLAGCPATTDASSLTAAIEQLGHARATARAARQDEFGDVVHWALAVAGGETGSESAWSFTAAGAWGAARLAIGDRRAERARADVKALAADCAAIVARRARREPAVRRTLLGGRPSAAALLRPVTVELADSAIELLDRMLPTVTLDGDLAEALADAAAHPAAA
jgi:hypothetical protein